jgi:HEAT repeat protein
MPWPNKPTESYLTALSDPDSRMREQAAAALESLGDLRAVEPLIAVLGADESGDVRAIAARALGKLGDSRTVEPLMRALQHPSEHLRESAVRALERLGDPSAAQAIFPLIEDPAASVRYNAARAAAKLGGARAVEPLMRALRQASGYLDPAINAALAIIGEPARAPLLIALQDEDATVRARAAGSLYSFRDDEVLSALRFKLQDADDEVRRVARSTIETILNGIKYAQVLERQGADQPAPPQRAPKAPKPPKRPRRVAASAAGDGRAAFDWQSLMTLWNAELLADEQIRAHLPPEVLAAGWMGYPGAGEEPIAALEARLGATLPPSYRAFLAFSNGWRHTGYFIPAIWSTEQVEWFAVRNQDTIDAWRDGERYPGAELPPVPDEEYLDYDERGAASGAMRSEYLQTALEISDCASGDGVYLLNPQILTPEGEWEAWFFAAWIPGAQRYRSFWELMVAEHQGYLALKADQR